MTASELSGLNLNHLVALRALLDECNVRRAALRMGVTQSAMSHTLAALRELLADPLLVRVGNRMVPTPYAQQIAPGLQRGLSELQAVVRGRAAFSPAAITDQFTLAMPDGLAVVFPAALHGLLQRNAPRARLRIAPVDESRLRQQLLSGDVDAAVLPPMIDVEGLCSAPVLPPTDSRVLVREGHPRIRKRLTLDAFCETPHAVLSLRGEGDSFIDHALASLGRSRRVAVRVPYFAALPQLVATTDVIVTVPSPAAYHLAQHWPLRVMRPPMPIDEYPLLLCWHERFDAEPASLFFRDQIRAAADLIESQQPRPRRAPAQTSRRSGRPGRARSET